MRQVVLIAGLTAIGVAAPIAGFEVRPTGGNEWGFKITRPNHQAFAIRLLGGAIDESFRIATKVAARGNVRRKLKGNAQKKTWELFGIM